MRWTVQAARVEDEKFVKNFGRIARKEVITCKT